MDISRHHHNRSITSLPLELLSSICIHLMHLDNPPLTRLYKLKHRPNTSFPLVCRLFRHVELHTPTIWTTISDEMCDEQIGLRLSRSRRMGMTVRLSSWGVCVCEKWKEMTGSCERWIELGVGAGACEHDCFEVVLKGLKLPRLTYICIGGIPHRANHILRTWSLPNVTNVLTLRLNNLLSLSLKRPLRTLRLSHGQAQLATVKLLTLFSSNVGSSELETLQMSFHGLVALDSVVTVDTRVELNRLKNLFVSFHGSAEHFRSSLLPFFERVTCPNATFVSLELTNEIVTSDAFVQFIACFYCKSLRECELSLVEGRCPGTWTCYFEAFKRAGDRGFVVYPSEGKRTRDVLVVEFVLDDY